MAAGDVRTVQLPYAIDRSVWLPALAKEHGVSVSEIRRLEKQGAIKAWSDGEEIPLEELAWGDTLRVGKHRSYRLPWRGASLKFQELEEGED